MRRLIFWFTGGGVYGGGAPAPPDPEGTPPRPPPAALSKVPRTALILARVSSAAFFTASGTAGAAGRFQLSVRPVTAVFMATILRRPSSAWRVIVNSLVMAVRRLVRSSAELLSRGSSSTVTVLVSVFPATVSATVYSPGSTRAVSYTHLRAHETRHDLVC